MAQERIAPTAIQTLTNLTPNNIALIQDDPDSPNGSWLVVVTEGNDTILKCSFPTPTTPPVVGANLQNFRILCRKTPSLLTDPLIVNVELYENGVFVANLIAGGIVINSELGEVIQGSWNANLLTDPTGAGVEVRVVGDGINLVGTLLDTSAEFGAVEWNAEITVVGAANYRGTSGPRGVYAATSSAPAASKATLGARGLYSATATTGPAENKGTAGVRSTYEATAASFTSNSGAAGVSGSYVGVVEGGDVGSVGASGAYAATAEFCEADPPERISPNVIEEMVNLVGVVGDIQDDPDVPDGSWLQTPLLGLLFPTSVRTSFPTPDQSLACENGLLNCEGEPFAFDGFNRADQACPFIIERAPGIADSGQVWIPAVNANAAMVIESGQVRPCPSITTGLNNTADIANTDALASFSLRSTIALSSGLRGDGTAAVSVSLNVRAAVAAEGIGVGISAAGVGQSALRLTIQRPIGTVVQSVPIPALPGDTVVMDVQVTPTRLRVLLDEAVYADTDALPMPNAPTQFGMGCFTASAGATDDGGSRFDDFSVQGCSLVAQGMQEFRALVRSTVLGIPPPLGLLAPTARLELWESATLLAVSPEFPVASGTGGVISWFWDPSLLADASGVNVEARLVGTPFLLPVEGFGIVGWTVEIGALEWNAAACSACRYHGSAGPATTYTPEPFSGRADYAGSAGVSGATNQTVVGAADYKSSLGAASTFDAMAVGESAYRGTSGVSGTTFGDDLPPIRRCDEDGPGSNRRCDPEPAGSLRRCPVD